MLLLPLLLFFACGGEKKKESKENTIAAQDSLSYGSFDTTAVITFDVMKTYPEKEITLQDIADVEYIPLETGKDILLNNSVGNICLVSDSNIVAISPHNGYCYVFDRKGRLRSSFVHQGNGGKEYRNILGAFVDEEKEEIYINDHLLKYRIQVYSFSGEYKRTLPLPPGMFLDSPHNYSSDYILCADSHIDGVANPRTKPYVLLSKKTGEIGGTLDILFHNRISPHFRMQTEKGLTMAKLKYEPIIKCNKDYIIGDISSDTIYSYTSEGVLSPLLVRTPSVYNMEVPVLLYPALKTERYFFFSAVVRQFDFNTMTGFPGTDLVYDYAQKRTFRSNLVNADFPSQKFDFNSGGTVDVKLNNTVCQLIPSEELIKSTVGGRLKDIALKQKEDDNPVLILVHFKR